MTIKMEAIVGHEGKLYGIRGNQEIFVRPVDHRRFGDEMQRAWRKHHPDDLPIPTHVDSELKGRLRSDDPNLTRLLHWGE